MLQKVHIIPDSVEETFLDVPEVSVLIVGILNHSICEGFIYHNELDFRVLEVGCHYHIVP